MESNSIILDSCQDFTKQCLKIGSPFTFSLSIWNGISFKFSVPRTNDQVCRNANWTTAVSTQRRKTPSQQRRDQRRWNSRQLQKSSLTPASGHLPETDLQPPVSGLQSPVTGSQLPATGLQLPVTGLQPPVTDMTSSVTGHPPPVTGRPPPVTGHPPPVTGQPPPVTGHPPPVADDSLLATGLQPQVIGLQSPVLSEIVGSSEREPSSKIGKVSPKITPMEMGNPEISPPSLISPMSSPTPKSPSPLEKAHKQIVRHLKPRVKVVDLDKKNWPQILLTKGKSSEFIDVQVIMLGDQNASLASLRRTLKKCNLRSTTPKDSKVWTAFNSFVPLGLLDYVINIPRKNLFNILINLNRNWTPVEDSKLYGFNIEPPGDDMTYVIHIGD